jgi:hypothetical protein
MNRELWDEWTTIHEGSDFYDLASFREGGMRLADYEIDDIGDASRADPSSTCSAISASTHCPSLGSGPTSPVRTSRRGR